MSEEPIRITLVRHGQSEANLVQRWQGQGDSPLSALGKQQAERLGTRLARRSYTRVVASDLQRAADTARATGFSFSQERALREFDVGAWEGLTREEVEARFPDDIERLKRGEDVPLGGGESYSVFSARVDEAFARLREPLAPGDQLLVVCHGGVIATYLSGLLGLRGARDWSLARVANTSLTELSFSAHGTLLHVFNDTLHLAELDSWPPYSDAPGTVCLVCDALPEAALGPFAAHYDVAPQLSALGPAPDAQAYAVLLADTVNQLHTRHPEQRVSLAAHGASIHAWAEATLLRGVALARDAGAMLAPPPQGSISHVGRWNERLLLLDYAVGG
ncbi:MAG TPA: histidine phosphatase family protein, partial [Polyangiales bacterium]